MEVMNRATFGPATGELVDALLSASGTLVAVAARSLEVSEGEVTLAQYRALDLLCSRGTVRVAELAEALAVSPPNATRMCSRLARKDLVRRSRSAIDRRSVRVSITSSGREVVEKIGEARRLELATIIDKIPLPGQGQLAEALRAFNSAAGDRPLAGCGVGG